MALAHSVAFVRAVGSERHTAGNTWLVLKLINWEAVRFKLFRGGLTASLSRCGPSSPKLPLCATPDLEVSPPSSNWKRSFSPLCQIVILHCCPSLWMVKVLHCGCSAGSGEDEEKMRCHALAKAAGVPAMKWLHLRWRSGLPRQRAAGGMAMKCSQAHSSYKMAGRKSEGCKQIQNNNN